jgi:hypothetical protein
VCVCVCVCVCACAPILGSIGGQTIAIFVSKSACLDVVCRTPLPNYSERFSSIRRVAPSGNAGRSGRLVGEHVA